jgi:uncharacterized membrane protein
MSSEREAIERLEQRVATLESLVRRLAAGRLGPVERVTPVEAPRSVTAAPRPQPSPPTPTPLPPLPAQAPPARGDFEQWVGQRGLLLVGVVALLATAGFFLNYAIEHGWIPPWLRASGSVAAGIVVVAFGERCIARGLRRYGAALIGAGGGLVYLGLWAAAGPYALISRDVGIMLLGLTAAGVAVFALRHDIEALALWALVGGDLAPAFLSHETRHPEYLFAYLAVVGGAALFTGERAGWRRLFNVALIAYFGLPALFAPAQINTVVALNYFAFGAALALLATHGKRWVAARLFAVVFPWVYFLNSAHLAFESAAVLALLIWWQHTRQDPLARDAKGTLVDPGDAVGYVVTPLLFAALALQVPPAALAQWRGVLPLALGLLYLGAGWRGRVDRLIAMGLVLVAVAIAGQWDGWVVALGWALLGVAALCTDRWASQRVAREAGVVLVAIALGQLVLVALPLRDTADRAFLGLWSLAWYVVIAGALLGSRLWQPRQPDRWSAGGGLLVALGGAAILIGGSTELGRAFAAFNADTSAAALGARLVLCGYWLVASLLLTWLVRDRPPDWLRNLGLSTAVALATLAFLVEFLALPGLRPTDDAAFVGVWPIGWYAIAVFCALAASLWRRQPQDGEFLRLGKETLWTFAGTAVFAGGSIELQRAFAGDGTSGGQLAANLAISTYWLVYAGALIAIGFALSHKAVRVAGLAVASLAALKVVLFDLSELEALYRVASFFVLALITLTVAYAYNRRARTS